MNKREIIAEALEKKIKENIIKLGEVPDYLIPKINISNDYAYPYLEIQNDGTIYIVIRERGVEYDRDLCINIDNAIFKLFEKITFELALNEEKGSSDYSLERIKSRQKELLDMLFS